ncbi:hypothetical protein [Moorena sp. SIO3B2]|nr:hypothetical protein [Moorena sp. SIO3B2]NEP37196.1 hypothetical protein [Moorena sp. SIO3B2]
MTRAIGIKLSIALATFISSREQHKAISFTHRDRSSSPIFLSLPQSL